MFLGRIELMTYGIRHQDADLLHRYLVRMVLMSELFRLKPGNFGGPRKATFFSRVRDCESICPYTFIM
jgi:hypothetical protein